MIATGPPVKEKRGGDLAATTPKLRLLIDHTPLICSAQDHCEHCNSRVEQLANGPHYAKEICTDCGRILRWIPKPATLERQQFNALRLARLAMSDQLSNWERNFIHSVSQRKKVSPKQQQIIDRLCAQYPEAAK